MDVQGGNRFFFTFEEEEGFLSLEETHHLVRVLRKKEGEKILLINGKGKEFEGEILFILKKGKELQARVKILKVLREEVPSSFKITALIPILKGDKTEFLVEKGTELGISKFIPFYSEFSVAKPGEKLYRRLKAKAISALKQSGRLFLPEIVPPLSLQEFLSSYNQQIPGFVGMSKASFSVESVIKKIFSFQEIFLISGPEGGFSKKEEELLLERGFIPLRMSPHILRAETASIALMSIFSFLIYNFKANT
jgi:16S rRNA (uracil1498-N3)-methyltransferase